MGRLSKEQQLKLAYIAGFLDGDGSIMLQLHRRYKGKEVYRVKTVICFYQDIKYRSDIEWIRDTLEYGYVYNRNDHICELRIEGYKRVFETLIKLKPYIRLKRKQVGLLIDLIPKLQQKLVLKEQAASWIKRMRDYNYFSSQRNSLEVPVTTDVPIKSGLR